MSIWWTMCSCQWSDNWHVPSITTLTTWVVDGHVTAILSVGEGLGENIGSGGHCIKQMTSEMNTMTTKTPKDMYYMTPWRSFYHNPSRQVITRQPFWKSCVTLTTCVSRTVNTFFIVIWDPLKTSEWVACFHTKSPTGLYMLLDYNCEFSSEFSTLPLHHHHHSLSPPDVAHSLNDQSSVGLCLSMGCVEIRVQSELSGLTEGQSKKPIRSFTFVWLLIALYCRLLELRKKRKSSYILIVEKV